MEYILNRWIDEHTDEMLDVLRQLIEIPSVLEEGTQGAPFGKPIDRALKFILEKATDMGFAATDYDGYAGAIEIKKGPKEIGILSHIDVVPAGNPSDWNYPPFEMTEERGKLFGRGVIDDKGPMVAALFAMRAIIDTGLPIKNSICHIIGTDEETAHRGLAYYLTKREAPWGGFSPDANFPVIHGEKGILRFSTNENWEGTENGRIVLESMTGGTVLNAVPAKAEAALRCSAEGMQEVKQILSRLTDPAITVKEEGDRIRITAVGKSTHAMQPWDGNNAVQKLLQVLVGIDLGRKDAWMKTVISLFGNGWKGEGLGIACYDQLSGPLTFNFGKITLSENKAECGFDIRYPIHIEQEKLWKTISLCCEGHGLKIVPGRMRKPLYVPKDSDLVKTLLSSYNEFTGEEQAPIVIGGGTYCRDVENFVSYGPLFPGEKEVAHEPNEFVEIRQLVESAKIYAQTVYRLANL